VAAAGVANPIEGPRQQINQPDGGFLLTIRAAANYLGISRSHRLRHVERGEIALVAVGRHYISRDQLTDFIDSHGQTGGNCGLLGTYH
jgi:excisionase family DNA binding protein